MALLGQQLPSMSPQQLAVLLWSLSVLRVRPGAEWLEVGGDGDSDGMRLLGCLGMTASGFGTPGPDANGPGLKANAVTRGGCVCAASDT